MTEKRKPTFSLASIQATFATVEGLVITATALKGAAALGLGRQGIVDVIQSIDGKHFVKSMTSHQNHTIWQDVYDVPSDAGRLYVKFTAGAVCEFVLISFKERDSG